MMQSSRLNRRLELVRHAGPSGVLVRAIILAAPLGGLACIHLAAADGLFTGGTASLDALVLVLTAVCLVYPDGHAGVAVLTALTAKWLIDVHHPTGWSTFSLAAAIAVFHSALAAAAIAPPSARWTRAMTRRWTQRTLMLVAAAAATAVAVEATSRLDLRADVLVLTTALTALAAGGLWVVSERRQSPRA